MKLRPFLLFVGWLALLAATLLAAFMINAIAPTVPLQFSLGADRVVNAIAGTTAETRRAIRWDFALPFLYMPTLIIWANFARRRFYVIPAAKELGRSLRFVIVLAGFADLIENALHLWLLSGVNAFVPADQWQAVWASSFAIVKWIGLAFALMYVLPATIWVLWLTLSPALPWQIRVQDLPSPGDRDDG